MSGIINSHHMSIELVERFAQCLLTDCKSKGDLDEVKQLGSYIMFFSNEIDMNYKRDQIFQEFLDNINCATDKLDSDSVLNHFNDEVEKIRMQLNKSEKCEKYINFLKMVSEHNLCHSDNGGSDNEIQTVSETVNTLDPISKLPIVEPVKNKKCGHIYEKSTMLQLIKKNPRTKCPIAGCNAVDFVGKDDLIPHNFLKRILSNIDNNSQKKIRLFK